MAQEAEATRRAKARLISSEGEALAAEKLKSAAEIMASSPATIQLRYLQTLRQVSHEKHHAIVFPLPTQLLDMIEGREQINWFQESSANQIAVQVA